MANRGERTTQRWTAPKRAPATTKNVRPRLAPQRNGGRSPHLPQVKLGSWSTRLLVLACLAAILVSGGWWLYRSPLLTVQKTEVVGVETLDPEVVTAAAGLAGQNLLRLDLNGARARVEALPQVRAAKVTRTFSRTVRITVEERQPAAFWMVGGRRYVVDRDGVILGAGLPDEGAPIINQLEPDWRPVPGDRVDAGAVELATRLLDNSERYLGLRVVSLEFRDSDGLTAVFDDGLRATFGDPHDFDYKVSALYMLMRTAEEQQVALHAVDLRFGDRLAFR